MSLQLTDVTLTLGDGDQRVTAIDDVTLSVSAGEMVAVVGPSGSGKSSLLAAIGCLTRIDSGEILIHGTSITDLPDKTRSRVRREEIGFVFQTANLFPSLNALDQLLLIPHLAGSAPKQHRERAQLLLDDLGVGHRAHHRPNRMSSGEQQRVGLARALMSHPPVLLADEPTAALDHDRSQEVIQLLADLTHKHQIATVLVTHNLELTDYADRVMVMQDGRLTPANP